MDALAQALLSPEERRTIDRLVGMLEAEFGPELRGVWLYGSRARGERTGDDSDVDLLVVSTRAGWDDHGRAIDLAFAAADAERANPMRFSVKLYHPDRIADRRRIRSFFMQEVDRDKIVLSGEP